jgi:hypothetical protein
MDITYDSKEEEYYSWWLDELVEAGHVAYYEYQKEIKITEDKYITLRKLNKKQTKTTEEQLHLFNDLKYTADFVIGWDSLAERKFFINEGSIVNRLQNILKQFHYAQSASKNGLNWHSYVDTKGTFAGANNTTAITFPIKQKMIYDKLGIYVNSIKPLSDKGLFANTFTPKKYMKTDITGKDRKISWTTRTLEEYVNGL